MPPNPDVKITTRVSCYWCGIPSGTPGVKLMRTTILQQTRYVETLLCQPCKEEKDRFGRRLSFWDWLAIYLVQLAAQAKFVLSFRRHLKQLRFQWAFRARGRKVRGEIAQRAAERTVADVLGKSAP